MQSSKRAQIKPNVLILFEMDPICAFQALGLKIATKLHSWNTVMSRHKGNCDVFINQVYVLRIRIVISWSGLVYLDPRFNEMSYYVSKPETRIIAYIFTFINNLSSSLLDHSFITSITQMKTYNFDKFLIIFTVTGSVFLWCANIHFNKQTLTHLCYQSPLRCD